MVEKSIDKSATNQETNRKRRTFFKTIKASLKQRAAERQRQQQRQEEVRAKIEQDERRLSLTDTKPFSQSFGNLGITETARKAVDAGNRMATTNEVLMSEKLIKNADTSYIIMDHDGVPKEPGLFKIDRKNGRLQKLEEYGHTSKLKWHEMVEVDKTAIEAMQHNEVVRLVKRSAINGLELILTGGTRNAFVGKIAQYKN